MDNGKGMAAKIGDVLWSPKVLASMLIGGACFLLKEFVPLAPLAWPLIILFLGIIGYCVASSLAWRKHLRAGVAWGLAVVLAGLLLFWGYASPDAPWPWEKGGNGTVTPTASYDEPSAETQKPVSTAPTQSGPVTRVQPSSQTTQAPSAPVRPKGGAKVIVSERQMDAEFRQWVERVVVQKVGVLHDRLRDMFVEVDVESLSGRNERAPGSGNLSSTGVHAKVSVVAYAANSDLILHVAGGTGRSVAFEGQERLMDQMKREALLDALESAFRQIP